MAKQTINIGASPNDGTGTPLRTAFDYCNLNFTELYTATGPSGNNIVCPGSATITGDLTVRTTGLTVNSSGVGVGITAALGAGNIQIGAGKYLGYSATAYITPEDNVQGARIKADNILIDGNTSTKFNIAGSTAMTLNSTGLNIANGNLILGTSGKGIDFSATTSGSGTMTSELLNDYEEGTWVPTQGSGLVVVGAFSSSGTYTKVGRLVTIVGRVNGATSVAATSGNILCSGLPFTGSDQSSGAAFNAPLNAGSICAVNVTDFYSVSAISATASIRFSATYFV